MKKFYATFGGGQPFQGYYVVIEAISEKMAHKAMDASFESWSMVYPEGEYEKVVAPYNYKPLVKLEVHDYCSSRHKTKLDIDVEKLSSELEATHV